MTKRDRKTLLAFARAERTGRWAPKLTHKAADIDTDGT